MVHKMAYPIRVPKRLSLSVIGSNFSALNRTPKGIRNKDTNLEINIVAVSVLIVTINADINTKY